MPDTASPVAASVRAELARAGVSGRELAAALGWSVMATSRRISGATPLRADELADIAAHLGIPVVRFYADPDEPAEAKAATS